MLTLSELRTKLKVYAQNENIDTTLANTLINDAYLEFYGEVKYSDLIEEYGVDTITSTSYDEYGTYVELTKSGVMGYKIIGINTKIKKIESTSYKIYLEVGNTKVLVRKYTNVTKLSSDSSATIFSNEAIDNCIVYFATAKYFDYINQDQKSLQWKAKMEESIKKLSSLGEIQDFISADSIDNATTIFNIQ